MHIYIFLFLCTNLSGFTETMLKFLT